MMAGLLLGAMANYADVIVDDFTGSKPGYNMLTNGGMWLADSDEWPAIGGSSRVRPAAPAGDTSNLVKGDAFAGDNIVKAYNVDEDPVSLWAKFYVKADAGPTKAWAYAAWIMDFKIPKPIDTTRPVYELPSWQKYHEVDLSSCTALELDLQFDKDRFLWIDLFSPLTDRMDPLAPHSGWKYTGTGAREIKKFNLTGITGPKAKWEDPSHNLTLKLWAVTRLRMLYEGLKTGSPTASYDTVGHLIRIWSVKMLGPNCAIVDNPGSSVSLMQHAKREAFSLSAAGSNLNFANLAGLGTLNVTVRDLSGKVKVRGVIDGDRRSLDVSALKNGVYSVQVQGPQFNRSTTVTLLK